MSWLGILSLLPFALLFLAVMIIIVLDAAGGDYGKRKVGEIFSSVYKLFHRPSPLQREIREEERTIKQLEAQKADIKRLAELRQERESLFEEVGDKHVERVGEGYAPQHQVDSRVKAFTLEGYTDLGIKMLDVNFADGTQTVFDEYQHDLELVKILFKSDLPFTERDVMK